MKKTASSRYDTSLCKQFVQDMEQLVLFQQEPIATLKLVAYAADAMRVLMALERQGEMSKVYEEMLRSACHDWRNPGSIDPADLITVVLTQTVTALQTVHQKMEQIIQEAN